MHTSVSSESSKGPAHAELKEMLLGRRREILNELKGKLREFRTRPMHEDGGKRADTSSATREADAEEDIEFGLLQIKAGVLNKINEALVRLEEGKYGYCFDCGEEIDPTRLRAVPFAVRCRGCQDAKDQKEKEAQKLRDSRWGHS